MSSQVLYADLKLAVPIFLIPYGEVSEKCRSFLNSISFNIFPIETVLNHTFQKVMKDRNIIIPQNFQAAIYVCHTPSEVDNIKRRLSQEEHLIFLRAYSVSVFIDYSVNKDIDGAKNFLSTIFDANNDFSSLILYQATESLINLHSEVTHISFESYKEDIAAANLKQFLTNNVLQSLQNKVTTMMPIGLANKQKAQQFFLKALSSDVSEQTDAFIATLKRIRPDNIQISNLIETMGLFELQNGGKLRELKILDRIPTEKQWAYREEEHNDAYLLFSTAAYFYNKNKDYLKVVDCAFRILNMHYDNDIAMEYVKLMCTHSVNVVDESKKALVFIQSFEFKAHLLRQKIHRKIPLFIFIMSEAFRGSAEKIDFQLQTLDFLYKQNPGEIVIRDICYPIVTKLLDDSCQLDNLTKCKMAFQFISICGTFLKKKDQSMIFLSTYEFNLGDVRIPCNLGLRVQNVRVVKMNSELRTIAQIQRENSNSSNSPFKYSFLSSQSSEGSSSQSTSCNATVGSQVRFEFEIYNPFAVDLPVSILAAESDFYDTDDYPHILNAKTFSNAVCYITPKIEGEITVDTVEILLSGGCQPIKLNQEIHVTAFSSVPSFAIRSNMPVVQTLNLFDGETMTIRCWLTNNGNVPIEGLSIKAGNFSSKDVKLPILPYNSINSNFPLTIDRNMSQINLVITAKSSNSKVETISRIVQPLIIESAISISSIQLLEFMPEIDTDFSNLIFIAVDVANKSSSVFNYSVRFKAAAELGFNFPGIITQKNSKGVLTAYETTIFILAVEKSQILSDTIIVENSRFINARRDEEERINHKLSSQQRKILNDRVRVAVFIENNLDFNWSCGVGRYGVLAQNTSLPSLDVMNEIQLKRPKLTHEFSRSPIPLNEKVTLSIAFEGASIVFCELDLGIYRDSDFGIVWEGALERMETAGADKYDFGLFFTKPGKFTFEFKYRTNEKVKGKIYIEAEILEE